MYSKSSKPKNMSVEEAQKKADEMKVPLKHVLATKNVKK